MVNAHGIVPEPGGGARKGQKKEGQKGEVMSTRAKERVGQGPV